MNVEILTSISAQDEWFIIDRTFISI